MNYKETYQEWITNPYFDEEVKAELRGIAEDEKEKEERKNGKKKEKEPIVRKHY